MAINLSEKCKNDAEYNRLKEVIDIASKYVDEYNEFERRKGR